MTRSSFTQNVFNSNVGEKGAALFQGTCNSTTIANSTFFNNTATNFGGAVFRSTSTGSLTGNAFSRNSAGRFGGAIYDVNVTGKLIFSLSPRCFVCVKLPPMLQPISQSYLQTTWMALLNQRPTQSMRMHGNFVASPP